MKNLKKYIVAIAMCLCIMFTSLTGCALLVPDNSKALEAKAVSVGSTVLTKKEVVDLWYNFYTENSSVFYYYSEEQIIEIFYKNIVLKHAIIQETNSLIDQGVLVYSAGDDAKVWLQVLEYFGGSTDTIEKALYTQQGTEDKNLPSRLQTESSNSSNSDVKSYLYTEYDFKGMEDYQCKYTVDNNTGTSIDSIKHGYDVTDEQVNYIIRNVLSTYLHKEQVEQPDGEEVDYINLSDLEYKLANNKYFKTITHTTNRDKAFDMLVGRLMLSAKAEGNKLNRQQALFEEVKEVYISRYETYLQNMYSNYITSLIDKQDDDVYGGIYYTLNDQAIVARYLQLLGSDIQKYKLEENYIAVLEATQDNALLLYRFEGKYYYFTVQHLLVGFDENIKNSLANMYGNQSNASVEQYDIYNSIRENFYKQLGLDGWEDYNNATYRDENGYDVYVYTYQTEPTTETPYVYFDKDYIDPRVEDGEEVEEDQVKNGYYYVNNDERVYLTKSEFETCKKATKTVDEVIKEFNATYKATIDYLNESNTSTLTTAQIKEKLEQNAAVSYIISEDLISAYMQGLETENVQVINELNNKVYTNLFMQHAFKYSTDTASLGTDLSDYVGMVISSRPDNHTVGGGTYVNEFTDKARELVQQYIANKQANNAYATGLVGTTTDSNVVSNFAISDYGIHMIVVNDVYAVEDSAPITGNTITSETIFGSKDNPLEQSVIDQNVKDAVAVMKSIYVSSTSSQTLYEYMYELVQKDLVGDSGTIYTQERNRLYKQYVDPETGDPKADLSGQMSYDELMDAIS